jgi:hypothetical protein
VGILVFPEMHHRGSVDKRDDPAENDLGHQDQEREKGELSRGHRRCGEYHRQSTSGTVEELRKDQGLTKYLAGRVYQLH